MHVCRCTCTCNTICVFRYANYIQFRWWAYQFTSLSPALCLNYCLPSDLFHSRPPEGYSILREVWKLPFYGKIYVKVFYENENTSYINMGDINLSGPSKLFEASLLTPSPKGFESALPICQTMSMSDSSHIFHNLWLDMICPNNKCAVTWLLHNIKLDTANL